MADKSPEEKDGLLELIKKLWLPVAGFLGAVTLAYNFYQLWLGDLKTVTYFTAGGGLIVLVIVLGWIGLSKKTIIHKKKTKSELRYSISYRRIAFGLLGIVVIGSGIGGWLLYKNSVSQAQALEKKIIILVAQFDGPEETYGLRSQIMEELHKVAEGYDDTSIIDGKEIVTAGQGSDYARKLGETKNADLVIWAWYKPTDNPNITIHFENLSSAQISSIKSSETYQPQATLAELESFEVQQRIGAETKTLISFIAGVVSYQSDDYQKALDRFEPILREENISTYINPVTLHFNIGYSYFNLGSYPHSLDSYNQVIALDPNYAFAYNNRGLVYDGLKDYDHAVQDYDKAIELAPSLAAAYSNRGVVYGEQGDFKRAIENFDKSIELESDSARSYGNRGNAYYYLGEYDRAIQDLNKAIELEPNLAEVYVNRGAVYDQLRDYVHAIQDYSKAIELNPNLSMAYNNRGLAYRELKDYPHAIQDLNKAIELDPNLSLAYGNRGLIYFDFEDYQLSIENYTRAIQIDPTYALAYKNRGLAHLKLGNNALAEFDFQKYEELTGQKP